MKPLYGLTARVFEDTRVLRAAHAPLGSQVVHQLFSQHSTRLDEQAAVDRFVRHAHPLVLWILGLQPPGNLLGRPFQDQFTRNDLSRAVYSVFGRRVPKWDLSGLLSVK
jgi:hypothetical protein